MTGRVVAILLAAGKSRRMGSYKQLLPLGNRNVVGRCLDTLRKAGIDEIIVVVSAEGHKVAAEAEKYPVKVVVNHQPDGDMASSVRAGRDEVPANVSGVVITLCDYPLVLPATIECLIRAHAEQPGKIIIPCSDGKLGHPLLFPRPVIDELTEDRILRDLVRQDLGRVHHVEVHDPGILIDMDTPAEYQRICLMVAAS